MSIKSSPFDEVAGASKEASNLPYNMPAINKQAHQFYQTAYVQNPGQSWVDKATIEETNFEMAHADNVQPSLMFEELNQTQITFPADELDKQKKKM